MNKTLLKSVREYKKQSILAPILVILEVLMEVLIPMEMANIIDIGMTSGDLHYIIQRGVILVVMAMLSLFFGISAGNMAAVAGAGYAKNLRHDIFYKVQEFSFKNIDHFATSGLVTRMTTDITNVQMAYMMSIRLLARAPIMILLSWIMTLMINVKIALLFLVVIPLLGGTLLFIAKKAHPHFIKVFDEYDELNNSVQENVNAARVVKAFVREDYEVNKFHGVSDYVYTLFTKAEKIVAWNSPVLQFMMYAVVILIALIGGRSIVFGTMETGELTSVIVYALQILMSLNMVTFVFVMIMIAEASTDRITEVLDEVPEMQDKTDAVKEVFSRFSLDGEVKEEEMIVSSQHVIVQTADGYFLRFPLSDVPEKKKGAVGVRAIKLTGKDTVEDVYLLTQGDELTIEYRGKNVDFARLKMAHRDTKGTKIRV